MLKYIKYFLSNKFLLITFHREFFWLTFSFVSFRFGEFQEFVEAGRYRRGRWPTAEQQKKAPAGVRLNIPFFVLQISLEFVSAHDFKRV